ncbi:universal stress protein [Pseudoteredinibacter isoporae]|uniref:Universal stress protein n=1 Tax=Pseudoteredinibacter isoporae TaxID=570281 RepID=A0A7X0JSS1_9GAMM|nr:universal stress protein [Pseudoteredinibacter isoporae]MBB6521577.1 universal stress protein A [Pseudoteredinibacter isoporae]NHO87131.1 universal stress protein [Pseudoteredinibacter isoporae]NIB22955.1 universal stress protein [Pseudoteredinibacter isoporae]
MASYQKALIAVDLSQESNEVIERGLSVANGCQVSLMHVIEPLTFAYGGDIPMDLSEVQEQLQNQAQDKLFKLASDNGISVDDCQVVVGQPASEIHRIADESDIDLIVVGSHGRSGLALLLGSTSNGVLHGANCDVLAVRVHPSD